MENEGKLPQPPHAAAEHEQQSWAQDERGLETVEWAIILGIIVATVIASVIAIGGGTRDSFDRAVQILESKGENDPGGGFGGKGKSPGKSGDNKNGQGGNQGKNGGGNGG